MTRDKALRCDCGHQVRGEDEAELVEAIRAHARDEHGIAFSTEEALLVVLRSQLDMSLESFTTDARSERASSTEGGEP